MKDLKGKKILFATVPGDGHVNPLTGLAKHLQEAGCDVRWYTSEIYSDKLEKLSIPHFVFNKVKDINGGNLEEMLPERQSITDLLAKFNFDMENIFGNLAPFHYEDIRDIYQSFSFELMIADSIFSAAPFVKVLMDIPVVSVGIVPLAEESVDLAPYGMGLLPAANEEQHAEYAKLRELAVNVLFKPSIDAYDSILKDNGITIEKSPFFDLLISQADLHLQIGSEGFEYKRSDLGENIRFIGALLPYSFQTAQKAWYDERISKYKNVILVTQGTVEKDAYKIIAPTLEAFQNTDTLVIATTGGNFTKELQVKYPAENLIIADYIPFSEVMPHADVYVTNGGYSGTLLAIKHELPMVAAGVHEGKNEVCARIGYFDFGINLQTETPTPELIGESVQAIIADKKYKENVTRLSQELNEMNPYKRATQYIQELISKSDKIAE